MLDVMATQAKILGVLGESTERDDGTATLPVELDAIPGAVWQAELQSLMPREFRVTLFERGSQKCAFLSFPADQAQQAYDAFEQALQGANETSTEAYRAAARARDESRAAER
jgi:hypothetical protein